MPLAECLDHAAGAAAHVRLHGWSVSEVEVILYRGVSVRPVNEEIMRLMRDEALAWGLEGVTVTWCWRPV